MKTCWKLFVLLAVVRPAFAAQNFFAIDVSGRAGNDGERGRDGSGSGSDGSNAGRSTPGEDAGDLDLVLKEGPQDGVFVIEGEVRHPPSKAGNPPRTQNTFAIGTKGYIGIDASGGKGGDGGRGGDGASGRRGTDGSDATRYSSGGDGGRGGDGGDGGDGTPGSSGGKGGRVRVRVDEQDMHLIMIVEEPNVSGGSGGAQGYNGSGGSGGPGGSGGSSYSWTEYETESYTDSNGQSQTRQVAHHHSNPGGSSGPSGSRGSNGSGDVSAGSNGKSGQVIYEVKGPQGVQAYGTRYNLEVESFEFDEGVRPNGSSRDGIFEPGEEIRIKNITFKNTGEMPMPLQKARLAIATNEWVLADGVELTLPKSLAPGESLTLEPNLHFKIADNPTLREGSRFATTAHLQLKGDLPAAERPFVKFGNDHKTFTVTYPIEIEPINSLKTLEAGKTSRMMWKVTNVSGSDFGGASELQRRIELSLGSEGSGVHTLTPKDLVFVDPSGKEVDLGQGLFQEIAHLKAGESTMFEGSIGLKDHVLAFHKAPLQLNLKVGSIENPQELRHIQRQVGDISVAQTYRKNPNSGILLVTNNKTTASEVEAWRKLGKQLHTEVDVWDLSHYGYLSMTEGLNSQNSTLVEDFNGKTLVLLNNEADMADGKIDPVFHLQKRDFLKAANEHGISFYVVGPEGGADLENFLVPTEHAEIAKFKSLGEYIKQSKKAPVDADVRHTNTLLGPSEILADADEVQMNKWTLFAAPKAEEAAENAVKAQSHLAKTFPERRYFVVHNFEPKVLQKGFLGIGNKWSYGNLSIQRSVDANEATFVHKQVDAETLHTPKWVLGAENRRSLLAAMPFDEKLKIAKELTSTSDLSRLKLSADDEVLLDDVLRSVEMDIVHEQTPLRQAGFTGNMWNKGIEARMPKLARLAELDLGASTNTPGANQVLKHLARLRAYNSGQVPWWEYLVPGRRNNLVSGVADKFLDRYEKKAMSGLLMRTPEGETLRKAFRAETEELKKESAALAKSKDISPRESSFKRIIEPWGDNWRICTDLDCGMDPAKRVLSGEKLKGIVDRDSDIARRIAAARESHVKTCIDMLIAGPKAVADAGATLKITEPTPLEYKFYHEQ